MASLYIFDFDDTLFKTQNTITVRNPETHEVEGHLSSQSLAEMEKELEESGQKLNKVLTFEDFHEVKQPTPIKPTQKIFKNIVDKIYHPDIPSSSSVYILTARESINIPSIHQALADMGYPAIPILTSDMFPGSSTAEKKKNAIRGLLNSGNYDFIEFFDDSISNINLVGSLQKEFPNVKIRLRPIVYGKTVTSSIMPRKNVPHRVDEIADSIMESMKKRKSKLSKERQYDIAYGTAWKQYYKENPKSKHKKKSDVLVNLKLAQILDDHQLYNFADLFDSIKAR